MEKNAKYDVVIIGAGIGGLVCGCYLAKAGLKVLMVESNSRPGGFCNSFSIKGFSFDGCAHSLGGVSEEGNIGKIIRELDLKKRFKISRNDPSDIIITSELKISFWNDLDKTIKEFQRYFPLEAKNIEDFFNFVSTCKGISLSSLVNVKFEEILDKYFSDRKLKAILSLPLLGNLGLPPSLLSSFSAITLYQEFMLDGGYYPVGGMGKFPELLAEKFKEAGGTILLSHRVEKINLNGNRVAGISIKQGRSILSRYVICNIDPRQTFIDLINEKEAIDRQFLNDLDKMQPSLSMFILYLGIDEDFEGLPKGSQSMWYLPFYDVEEMYSVAIKHEVYKLDWFLFRVGPDRNNILAFVNAPFVSKEFWQDNREAFIRSFLKRLEKVIPNLSQHVVFKTAATPFALSNWTSNFAGASYGWASIPSQLAVKGFSQATPIKNLYLTGHWATLGQGIPGVAYLGRSTANIILKREKIK